MKLQINKTQWLWLGSLLAMAALVAFFLLPWLHGLAAAKSGIAERRLVIRSLEESATTASQTPDEQKLAEQRDALDALFISRGEILEFLSRVESIAAAQAVTETIGLTEFPEAKDTLIQHPLTLQASGTPEHLMAFLHELETLPYYINVQSISLGGGSTNAPAAGSVTLPSDTTGTTAVEMHIEGYTYWKP